MAAEESGGGALRKMPDPGSMSKVTESFFATLECELLDRRTLHTKAEARMAVFEFIEGWYNPGRRHSALGYQIAHQLRKEYP
jgi:transposase InsO family protein